MSFAPTAISAPRPSGLPRGPTASFLGVPGRARYGPFSGARDTLRKMHEHVLGDSGEPSVKVREFTEWVIAGVEPKDYLGEIVAIRNVFLQDSPFTGTALFRYTNDPRHIEWVKTPERIVREIEQKGSALIDCDEATSLAATMALQIGRVAQFVALGFNGQLTHVALRVQEPKSGRWIWMDSVAGPRERHAAESAKQRLIWSLD